MEQDAVDFHAKDINVTGLYQSLPKAFAYIYNIGQMKMTGI